MITQSDPSIKFLTILAAKPTNSDGEYKIVIQAPFSPMNEETSQKANHFLRHFMEEHIVQYVGGGSFITDYHPTDIAEALKEQLPFEGEVYDFEDCIAVFKLHKQEYVGMEKQLAEILKPFLPILENIGTQLVHKIFKRYQNGQLLIEDGQKQQQLKIIKSVQVDPVVVKIITSTTKFERDVRGRKTSQWKEVPIPKVDRFVRFQMANFHKGTPEDECLIFTHKTAQNVKAKFIPRGHSLSLSFTK